MSNDSLHHTVDTLKEKAHEYRAKAEHSLQELPSMEEMESEATGRTASALRIAERTPDAAYLGAMAGSMALSLLLLGRRKQDHGAVCRPLACDHPQHGDAAEEPPPFARASADDAGFSRRWRSCASPNRGRQRPKKKACPIGQAFF